MPLQLYSPLSVVYYRVHGAFSVSPIDVATMQMQSQVPEPGDMALCHLHRVDGFHSVGGGFMRYKWRKALTSSKVQVIVLFKKIAVDGSLHPLEMLQLMKSGKTVLEIWQLRDEGALDTSSCVWLDFTLCSDYAERGWSPLRGIIST